MKHFITLVLLAILAGIAAAGLTGCASMQPAINAAEAAAVTNIRAAEDNNIKLWSINACGTPFSAAIRHPEVVPALKALCLPQGDMANPANLLNAIVPAK